MAKDPKATFANPDDQQLTLDPGVVSAELTYVPGQQDPVSVKWGGHVFHANMPKTITGRLDGNERERVNAHVIERARENPHFTVDGKRAKNARLSDPKTPDEYKRYFVSWLKNDSFDDAGALLDRFVKDRNLQIAAEVGPDDFAFMRDLFNPKLYDLAKAEGLTEPQIASMWAERGVNVLPWL